MHFILAHHHGLRAEPLNDRPNMRANGWRGDQYRNFPLLGGAFKALLNTSNELLQTRRRHGEVAIFAITNHGFSKITFPLRRQCQQR